MLNNNIFYMHIPKPIYSRNFNDKHKENLILLDTHLEKYRKEIKNILIESCNNSYLQYKKEKNLTLKEKPIKIAEGEKKTIDELKKEHMKNLDENINKITQKIQKEKNYEKNSRF